MVRIPERRRDADDRRMFAKHRDVAIRAERASGLAARRIPVSRADVFDDE